MRNTTTVVIAAGAVLAAVSQAATIHVDVVNCPGPGDGSIGDPYCSIQTAIDNAVDTDEIIVSPGTYFETINFIGKAITVRSIDPDDPDVVAETIIDGGGVETVVTCETGEGADTILRGFVITGGVPIPYDGGGMLNLGSSPTVSNCVFTGNTADGGGGMLNDSGSPTVINCMFSGNTSTSDGGGGMSNHNGSSPMLIDCTFTGNTARTGGGLDNDISSPTVFNCTFSENNAEFGGGMFNGFGSSPTVTNCTFSGNTAIAGGGMLNDSSTATVTNTVFCDNTPDAIFGGYIDGGGNVLACTCPSDLDGDGTVGITDFLALLAAWGPNPGHPADIDNDGTVGITDFLGLLAAWGPCK